MQDLKPADGKEVFILTVSVKLQGKKGNTTRWITNIFTNKCRLC
jgi:hypothetical protein